MTDNKQALAWMAQLRELNLQIVQARRRGNDERVNTLKERVAALLARISAQETAGAGTSQASATPQEANDTRAQASASTRAQASTGVAEVEYTEASAALQSAERESGERLASVPRTGQGQAEETHQPEKSAEKDTRNSPSEGKEHHMPTGTQELMQALQEVNIQIVTARQRGNFDRVRMLQERAQALMQQAMGKKSAPG